MASKPTDVDFALRLISDDGGETGAIVLECDSVDQAFAFLEAFVEHMYPPGGRGSTILSISSTPPGSFLYEARSDEGVASIFLTGLDRSGADFISKTIKQRGGVLIAFAGREGGQFTLLDPEASHLVRTYATIDGASVEGSGPVDFSGLIADLKSDFPWREADVQ